MFSMVSGLRLALSCAIPCFATAWVTMLSDNSGAQKVTVVGGTGFVGSRVCQQLVSKGASVTSVSKTGTVPKWCAGEPWTSDVNWVSVDLLTGDEMALDMAVGKPDAIVSCVGVVGTDREKLEEGNGAANVAAFASAKRGGRIKRSAFVSVASEVSACEEKWLPEFFGGYFEGKRMSEEAARDAVDGDVTQACIIVRPTFIYGGDTFGLLPPRVNFEYGSGVEELLSLGVFKVLADILPGLIKVALRPPSSVDAVAAACASAALGEIQGGVLDGASEINSATNHPAATGLTEALTWTKENAIKAYDWTKAKIEEAQKE